MYLRAVILVLFMIVNAWSMGSLCYAADKPSLLVIRAHSKDFQDSMEGLSGELSNDFAIHELLLSNNLTVKDVEKKIREVSPKVVVLMDNKATSLFKAYQSQQPGSAQPIPSVSIMGVFINLSLKGIKNATGISYEVPIVTSIVSLRAALDRPFSKVGIVHREILKEFLETNKTYCNREGVEIVNYEIPSEGDVSGKVKKYLKKCMKDDKVDAIWVPNDNNLLNSEMLQEVWLPFASKFKKPIIVGVEVLVNPKFNFGTFAVIPDHKSLGMQAAEKVFDIMDNNWQVESSAIDPPTSVYKVINFKQVKEWYGIGEDQLKNVDKIVK